MSTEMPSFKRRMFLPLLLPPARLASLPKVPPLGPVVSMVAVKVWAGWGWRKERRRLPRWSL